MAPRQLKKPKSEQETREAPHMLLWTKHISSPDKKKEFQELLAVSSGPVWQRLLSIVREEKDRIYRSSIKPSSYDSPSWALQQADNVGYIRALDLIEHLIKGIVK